MHRKNGPAKAFYFKQFQIEHDRCAMKVGTDGVLLGAWANVENRKCILDVGTGSGLIALMVAQRSNA
ncbi:MAG TPA: methyltransferase, partial [Cyclobacteriaceae bacterium]|nr:methyltransferase [Cyclobacteriaceae bacterium]